MERLAFPVTSTKEDLDCPPDTLNAHFAIFIVDNLCVSLLCLLVAENESKRVADNTYIVVQLCLLSKLRDSANSCNFDMLRIFCELCDKMISLKDIAQIVRLRIFKQSRDSVNVFPHN